MVKNPKKILIIRTDRIGDVVLSTPVIQNLREHFKSAHIAFMCWPYTREILEGNPYLDEVIVYDKYGIHKNLFSSIKFSFYLRRKKFDWAIILHPTTRVNMVTFLAGIPFRIGWDKKGGFLLSKKIFHNKQEGKKHELDYTLDVLREMDLSIIFKETYFPVIQESEEVVKNLLKSQGINENDKFIVINPSASCPSKRWPQKNFIKLIGLLRDRINIKILVITSKAEKELAQEIVGQKGVIDLRGKVSILELGALLKRSNLLISNDSGPVHIAASLNTPVIAIFGRKNPGLSPKRWKPLGENSFYFHKDAGCKICLAHNCKKHFFCINIITPLEVADKAFSLLLK